MEFQELGRWSEDYFKHRLKRPINIMIFSWWDEIVGDTIAEVTQPIYFKKGILGVEVIEEAWRAELGYHAALIIQKYREKISQKQIEQPTKTTETTEIKGIRFKYNPYMEKKAKPMKNLNLGKTEISKPIETLKPVELLCENNFAERMNVLLGKLQGYTHGKNLRPSMVPTSFTPAAPTTPSLSRPSSSSQHRISLYYPDTGLYSEFILPPDELQNFDLY